MSLDVYLHAEDKDGRLCEVYEDNITHNLNTMANEAGIYKAMWRPEDLGATRASELIPLLEDGLALLHARPDHFKTFDASNGWGVYDNLVGFVERYLMACRRWPHAKVEVSR